MRRSVISIRRSIEMTTVEMLALGAFLLNAIGAVIGLTWGLGSIRDQLKDELRADFDELKTLINDSSAAVERNTGESVKAVREKIIQVEFYIRDNYVREKEFDAVIKSMENRFDRLQDAIDRMNEKLDKKILSD